MTSSERTRNQASPGQPAYRQTIIVGISGPSSSGKTTLARLLRTVFTPESKLGSGAGNAISGAIENKEAERADRDRVGDEEDLKVFIVHEDDFYKPDDQIPVTTTSSGKRVQDWDAIDALDIRQLVSALSYVRSHGILPPRLKSKEDLNEVTDSGVAEDTIRRFQADVARRMEAILSTKSGNNSLPLSLAFLEGFLLYAPPDDKQHPLRDVHDNIHVPLFLPATYSLLKERRESRTGYVTIGPAPTPKSDEDSNNKDGSTEPSADGIGDIEGDEPMPHQNFWTDPPGYVDDIVWPRYITDHQWLLLRDPGVERSQDELKEAVGEGEYIKEDAGVLVAPGKGGADMTELLEWGVREVLRVVEREVRARRFLIESKPRHAEDAYCPQRINILLKLEDLRSTSASQSSSAKYFLQRTQSSRAWEKKKTFKMDTPRNLSPHIAATLILLLFSNQIHAQEEDRRPLSSPDVGWRITTVSGSKSAMRVVCDHGDTFTKSGSYYTCCPASATTPCLLPTTCSSNTLLFPGDKTRDCKNNICASLLIYESAPTQNLLGTQLVCRYDQLGDNTPWSVYRNFPDTTTSATQSTSTNASPAPTARPPIMTGPGNSPNPPESTPISASNKIWIAGVVVGVIALGFLIGFLGFCIARRRLQKRPTASKDDDMVPVNTPSVDDKDYMYKAYQGAELHNHDRAELHFDQRPVELSHYGSNVVEMPIQHERQFVAELDGAPLRR
ncbi:nicotinamide riboside kinase [Blastomyces parvus]|uniref:Nicotinamide riboside kinase n=1 Tax=Blastomyces parvus TaxID=2060905 RepID=A0A2B7WQW5_9EURO|nr:nicotinamide riboside kinase [Blastomyces parvus]